MNDNVIGAGSGVLSFIVAEVTKVTDASGWKFIGLTLAAGALGYIGKEAIVFISKSIKKVFNKWR